MGSMKALTSSRLQPKSTHDGHAVCYIRYQSLCFSHVGLSPLLPRSYIDVLSISVYRVAALVRLIAVRVSPYRCYGQEHSRWLPSSPYCPGRPGLSQRTSLWANVRPDTWPSCLPLTSRRSLRQLLCSMFEREIVIPYTTSIAGRHRHFLIRPGHIRPLEWLHQPSFTLAHASQACVRERPPFPLRASLAADRPIVRTESHKSPRPGLLQDEAQARSCWTFDLRHRA